MKTIGLNEEQRKKICDEIAKLVFEFKKDKKVECIYFSVIDGYANIHGNVLTITLVKNKAYDDVEDRKIIEYNDMYKGDDIFKKFGIRIFIEVDVDANCYTKLPMTRWEYLKFKHIFNSVILYDKTGEYTKIKESTEKSESDTICYYSNHVEIVPPIINELNKAMEIIGMRKEADNLKKFTKTKTFQKIIDM